MMWLPIVIYVPALAFNQGLLAKNNIFSQFKTNIRSFVTMISCYSFFTSHRFVRFIFAEHICSDRCQCPLDNTYCLSCVHFLHLCRRIEGCRMDGLHTVRAFNTDLYRIWNEERLADVNFFGGFVALIEKYRPLILDS